MDQQYDTLQQVGIIDTQMGELLDSRYREFSGSVNSESFEKEYSQLNKEAQEGKLSNGQHILLDIQMNAMYGHVTENSATLKSIFGTIVNTIALLPQPKLENGKILTWGKISEQHDTLDTTSYKMPRII